MLDDKVIIRQTTLITIQPQLMRDLPSAFIEDNKRLLEHLFKATFMFWCLVDYENSSRSSFEATHTYIFS